jgi:hypothetical protein
MKVNELARRHLAGSLIHVGGHWQQRGVDRVTTGGSAVKRSSRRPYEYGPPGTDDR